MGRNYTKKYKIAGQSYSVKPEKVINEMIERAKQLIPGFPSKRKFSDATFNMIFRAVTTEIDDAEKETKSNKDIVEFFTEAFSS